MKQVDKQTNYSIHPVSSVLNFYNNQQPASILHNNSHKSYVGFKLACNADNGKVGRLPFKFKSKELEAVYLNRGSKNYPTAVVKRFLKAMWMISAANNEQDLYSFKSLKFHKLNRNCKQEYALSLTGNWRLITKFEEEGGIKYLLILKIEDYH